MFQHCVPKADFWNEDCYWNSNICSNDPKELVWNILLEQTPVPRVASWSGSCVPVFQYSLIFEN